MLKIWGRISSINVRKVVLAAQWAGVPFERIDAGASFGVTTTPEYLAMNPNALVPTIQDGAFNLWESNVIVRYLCARYSPDVLYPADLQERFEAERWMDWQQTTLNPAGREAFIQHFRTAPEKRDPAAIRKSIEATEPLFAWLDRHLGAQPFVAGSRPTMADIPLACEVHRWWAVPIEHPERPHLRKWYEGILSSPAARGALDVQIS